MNPLFALQVTLGFATAAAVAGLLRLRHTRQPETTGSWREALAGLVAMVVAAGPITMAFVYFVQNPFDVTNISAFARGAMAGGILVVLMSGGTSAVVLLANWALGRPLETPDLRSVVLEQGLLLLLGALLFGTVIWTTEGIEADGVILLILGVFYVTLFVGQALLVPWLSIMVKPTLVASTDYDSLQEWLDQLMLRYGNRPIPVRVQDGTLYNAFVLWKPGRPLLVVGRQLLTRLSEQESRAVLAHEAAHLVRKDTVVLVWFGLVAALSMAPATHFVAWPLMAGGQPVVGAGLVGLLNGGLAAITGFYMRRMEFRTDQLAVEMMGGRWEALAAALEKLAELKRVPLERKTLTHPSVRDRIARMQDRL
jgi:Zn-dependent protease with chaperone function